MARVKKNLKPEIHAKPDISLSSELYAQLKPFRIPLILIQFFVVFGTIGYLVLEDYDLMQAFFQTTYTFTNTGFGALKERDFGTITIIYHDINGVWCGYCYF